MVALLGMIDTGHDLLVFSDLFSLCYHGHCVLKLLCSSFTDAERENGDCLLGKLLTSWGLPDLSYIVSEVKSFRRIHPIVLGTIEINYTMGWSSQSFGCLLPTPHTNSFTRYLFSEKELPISFCSCVESGCPLLRGFEVPGEVCFSNKDGCF